jgi:hypothetical protein
MAAYSTETRMTPDLVMPSARAALIPRMKGPRSLIRHLIERASARNCYDATEWSGAMSARHFTIMNSAHRNKRPDRTRLRMRTPFGEKQQWSTRFDIWHAPTTAA